MSSDKTYYSNVSCYSQRKDAIRRNSNIFPANRIVGLKDNYKEHKGSFELWTPNVQVTRKWIMIVIFI